MAPTEPGTTKQTTMRLSDEDLALLEALQAKLGIGNRSDVVRLAIRKLAELESVKLPARRKRR